MTESERDFTIKSYIDYLSEEKLMGSKCKDCGASYVPVRKLCTKCNSTNMEWSEMSGKGKIAARNFFPIFTTTWPSSRFRFNFPYSFFEIERIPLIIFFLLKLTN